VSADLLVCDHDPRWLRRELTGISDHDPVQHDPSRSKMLLRSTLADTGGKHTVENCRRTVNSSATLPDDLGRLMPLLTLPSSRARNFRAE
jgi:hypothetical protein